MREAVFKWAKKMLLYLKSKLQLEILVRERFTTVYDLKLYKYNEMVSRKTIF